MNKTLCCILTALAAITPGASMALDIDFETTSSYKSVGVYDAWESSPFRTGSMTGNFAVVDNPSKDADPVSGVVVNPSDKVLGAQRSRFGSNLFGARVDLNEPVQLSTSLQYVHVMMYRPNGGRVALVALGKRDDRADQTGEEEQLWVLANNTVSSNAWCDAVFPVKGSNDVKLYSFVVVPECESPHDRADDFLFYIDDITINNSISPRLQEEYYEINNSKETSKLDRSDRYLNSFKFTSPKFGAQTVTINQGDTKNLYYDLTDNVLRAKAGETLSFETNWAGSWMHSYVYIDRDDNGHFEPNLTVSEDGRKYTLTSSSELVSFSWLGYDNYGYNSVGTSLTFDNRDNHVLPNYTLPADMKPGMYRLRVKMDWNSSDAGGDVESIISNGGCIADILLSVTDGSEVSISANQLNGDVADSEGNLLSATRIPYGEAYMIKMLPAPGFQYQGINVTHGWKLDGNQMYHNNRLYKTEYFDYTDFDFDDCLVLPAEMIDGDVFIEGLFVEDGTLPKKVRLTYNLVCDDNVVATAVVNTKTGDEYPKYDWNITASEHFYEIEYPEGAVQSKDAEQPIEVYLLHNLPYEPSTLANPIWYNMTIAENRYYLQHNPSLTYISLASSTTTKPDETNDNALWAFVGDVYNGFKIYNKGAGNDYILSSSTNTSSNTGGSTYPRMIAEASVPSSNNTYWIPTVSDQLGLNGFFLEQKGLPSNRMNNRDNRLAYWTGGADKGSTFLVERVTPEVAGVEVVENDFDYATAEYFTLQGIRVEVSNLVPGIYIARNGVKTVKILVK